MNEQRQRVFCWKNLNREEPIEIENFSIDEKEYKWFIEVKKICVL